MILSKRGKQEDCTGGKKGGSIAIIYKRSVKTEAEKKRLRQQYKEVVIQLFQKILEIEDLRDRLSKIDS